jgi:hypothetical protein
VKRGVETFEHFALIACLADRSSPAGKFLAAAERAGIADTDLGAALAVGGPVVTDRGPRPEGPAGARGRSTDGP